MAKDYLHYTADDFIADEYFQRWAKYPDKETNAFWKNWINEHPEQRDHIMKATAFINHLTFREEIPNPQKMEASLNRSLQIIHDRESSWKFRIRNKAVIKNYLAVIGIAAIFFVAFALWKHVFDQPGPREVKTASKEIRNILLPDSTMITLNGNASLKYTGDFDAEETREVWLNGEAFFKVNPPEKNTTAKQFIVHSGLLNVEVPGSSFNIRKREDTYNVSVNSGNIKLAINDGEGTTIFLRGGEFFQYSSKEKSLIKKKVNPEWYSGWKYGKIKLDHVPLSEVASLVHDIYGYHTIVSEQLASDKISGTLILKDEETLFKSLSSTVDINIIKKDKDLFFQMKTKAK